MGEYTLLEEELEKQYEVYVRRFRNVEYLEHELDRLRVAEHAKQARAERRLRRMQQEVQAEEERRLGRGGKKAGVQGGSKGGGGVFAKVRFGKWLYFGAGEEESSLRTLHLYRITTTVWGATAIKPAAVA